MNLKSRGRCGRLFVLAMCVVAATPIVSAQQESPKKGKGGGHRHAPESGKQDAPKKKRRVEKHKPRVEPHQPPSPGRQRGVGRAAPRRGKVYLPTRRTYGHVRVSRYPRRPDGHIHAARLIARSQRLTPVVLERFDHRHREEITAIIRFYREHDRGHAIDAWGHFIDGLADHHGSIDLDELMMYIAREAGHHGGEELAYHGRRLHYLQDWQDLLLDYIADLRRQLDECMGADHPCSERTIRNIDHDLARARADLDVARTQEHLARDQFETRLQSAGDYGERFGSVYEEIYRSVEVRIIVSD